MKWEDYPENPIVVWPCLIWVSFMEISLWECAYTRKFSEILHASKEFTTKTGMKDLFFFFFCFFSCTCGENKPVFVETSKRNFLLAKFFRDFRNFGSKCHMFFLIVSICHSSSPSLSVSVLDYAECDYLNTCMFYNVDSILQNHIQGSVPAYFHSFLICPIWYSGKGFLTLFDITLPWLILIDSLNVFPLL